MTLRQISLVSLAIIICALPASLSAQTNGNSGLPGDRITAALTSFVGWVPASLPRDTYRVGPGDVLSVKVDGEATLNYHVRQASPQEDPDQVTVTPGGEIYVPLAGSISVAGKTVADIEQLIRSGLGKYIRAFRISVAVASVRTVNVWVSGEVENSGPQILPAVATVSLSALQARIKPTGSTRGVTLVRGKDRRTIDLYRMGHYR